MLIIPVIAEQFLTSLMGLADSMMVSNVDDYSLGAVQLVDSINILVNIRHRTRTIKRNRSNNILKITWSKLS
jgi:hypothetical protein